MALMNPLGKMGLDSTLQKIARFLEQIAGIVGKTYPDTSGRARVNVEIGTLTSVTTVNTLNNQNQQSGFQTSYDQYAQIQMCANGVRSQIKVS